MAEKHIFNIGCPRCDTQVIIRQNCYDYHCTSCQFHIKVNDPKELLKNFCPEDLENIVFTEKSFKELNSEGHSTEGLQLTLDDSSVDSEAPSPSESSDNIRGLSDESSDNKVANTQIIHLSFDPAAYLEEATKLQKTSKETKISLKKVIRNSEYSRPPQKTTPPGLYILLGAFLFAVITAIILIFIS